ERGIVPRIRTHWPTSDSLDVRQRDLTIGLFREADPRYLGDDLSATALRNCRPIAPAPIVVIQHDIRAQHWDETTARLLHWYLHDYWGSYRESEPEPQFLVFLKVTYPSPESTSWWRSLFRSRAQDKVRIQQQLRMALGQVA